MTMLYTSPIRAVGPLVRYEADKNTQKPEGSNTSGTSFAI